MAMTMNQLHGKFTPLSFRQSTTVELLSPGQAFSHVESFRNFCAEDTVGQWTVEKQDVSTTKTVLHDCAFSQDCQSLKQHQTYQGDRSFQWIYCRKFVDSCKFLHTPYIYTFMLTAKFIIVCHIMLNHTVSSTQVALHACVVLVNGYFFKSMFLLTWWMNYRDVLQKYS